MKKYQVPVRRDLGVNRKWVERIETNGFEPLHVSCIRVSEGLGAHNSSRSKGRGHKVMVTFYGNAIPPEAWEPCGSTAFHISERPWPLNFTAWGNIDQAITSGFASLRIGVFVFWNFRKIQEKKNHCTVSQLGNCESFLLSKKLFNISQNKNVTSLTKEK